MKKVTACRPKTYKTGCNFKLYPYLSWTSCGGMGIEGAYPLKYIRAFIHRYDIVPTLWINHKTARLCFVQAQSLYYDTFSSVASHEIIPFVWDCWPHFDDKLCKWIARHGVKACIFTSKQAARRIKERIPYLNVLALTEGINLDLYPAGKRLIDRETDLYTFGRQPEYVYNTHFAPLSFLRGGTDKEFKYRLQNSKVTICVPRCDVTPEQTGGQETLTQRYWECMLSRVVIVGRAPKELIDLTGYNPVIDIDMNHLDCQIKDIVGHVTDYQEMIDHNRETALRIGSWDIRMKQVMEWLRGIGYDV